MRGTDYEYYVVRPESKHDTNIPDRRRRDERTYDALVEDIFKHKRAAYEPETPNDDRRTRFARHFYTEYYIGAELVFGGPEGAPVDTAEFMEDVVLAQGEIDRNNLFYLLGEIGVGKTAYVNWLITTLLRDQVANGLVWFMRLDFEELKQGQPVSPQELLYHLINAALNRVEKHPNLFEGAESQLIELRLAMNVAAEDIYDANLSERAAALCALARKIQGLTGRRLLLIFDNIDYLCHLNDRGLYYDDADTGEKHTLLQLYDLLALFNRPRELGHLGANVLIVTRFDCYNVLTRATVTSYRAPSFTREAKTYVVKSPGWRGVVDARCKLLRAVTNEVEPPGKRRHFNKIPDSIENDLNSGEPRLIEHLLGITNHGLREMMGFFSQYGWVARDDDLPGEPRFIHAYPVGLLTFMLNRKARFSQFGSKFPNIYLVNRIPAAGKAYSKDHEHAHTYWLKRLITHAVASGHFRSPVEIVELFHCDGKGYEGSIIRECLGSLTDATCSHCITVCRGLHPDRSKQALIIEKIELNERGLHCLTNIFDRFFYLQLVVEDPLLPIPRVVAEEFSFDILDRQRLDYTYVVETHQEYVEKAIEMVKVKAKQVLLFLEILDRALFWEQHVYSDVFERLAARRVEIPSVSDIRNSVVHELLLLNPNIGNRVDLSAVANYVVSRRDEIDKELGKAYESNAKQ